MIAEVFGLSADRFGEDPQVVVQALHDDIEMAFDPFFAPLKLFTRRTTIKPTLEPLKTRIDSAETSIHRAFKL